MNNKITCRKVQHWDGFGNAVSFYCQAKNIPDKYIKAAKEIDGEDFGLDAFVVCMNYGRDGFAVAEDSSGGYLFYQDAYGKENYMEAELSELDVDSFKIKCRKEILAALDGNYGVNDDD